VTQRPPRTGPGLPGSERNDGVPKRDAPASDRMRDFYRRLLRLYPRAFRERYAADLLQAFDDRRGEARFRGPIGGVRLVLFLLRDFATSMPMTHDSSTRRRGVNGIMNDVLRDLRFSVRMLVKNPMFTLAAVTTLALGIGLNAATFSAVHGILLRPLPGAEDPEELVQIYRHWAGIEHGSVSIPHYQDLRDRTADAFDDVAAWYFEPLAIAAEGASERTMGMVVSANFFQTYGVQPAVGRPFLPGVEDRDPGAHPVAILSYGFWQTRFGGDPAVVGTTVSLNGHPFEIVGVAPADFRGPVTFAAPPIYVPIMMANVLDPSFDRIQARGSNSMTAVARLRDGVTVERAAQSIESMLMQLREEYPESYDTQLGHTLVLQSEAGIHPNFASAQMSMSTVMMVVVSLLLLIACVNVANLFLARARDRRREMGIRISMGAGRGRIVQQLLTESLLFSAVAGAAGVVLARFAVRALAAFRPPIDGPWAFNVEMSPTVLWFTAAISLASGFVFGMAPALQAARPDTVSAIKGEASAKAGGSRMSSGLVVVQMALSLLLLISSGLFLRSLQSATRIDPGFESPRSIAMASVDPGLQGLAEPEARAFWDRMLEDVRALPEVSDAALTLYAPLGLSSSDRGIAIPGYEFGENERNSLRYSYVSEGYIETMGIELLEGRTFERSDAAESAPVMIVNRRFAERFWPNESALGKIVQTAGRDWQIVGVVETGKYGSLGEEPQEFMYFPYRAIFQSALTIVARTPGDPGVVLQRLRELVRTADPDMPVYDVRSMEDHLGIALLPARLGGTVLGLFGLLGLTLAAVGIYGVMAYSVARRRRELGIRVALGADRRSVLRLVLREGLRLAVIGTAIGIVGALAAARLVQGLLYGVRAVDPVAFTLVPATLVAVAALAVYLPARRAAAVDPIGALKSE
jgi:macrolide transport system ATP-binding/permease protein